MRSNIETIARDFILALENRVSVEEILSFYHPEIEQTEYPNTLTRNKAVRKLEDIKIAFEKGGKVLQKEKYEILNLFSFGNTVFVEAIWTGTLAIPIGNLKAGEAMIANFAQVFEFKDDKIYKQRNYDCFEPFS